MKKRVLSLFMALILCLSLLPMSALAEEISWPEIGSTVRIDNVDYTYKGDFTSLPLDLTSSNYPGSCIFKAGNGYVLCNKNTKKVILYNAEITASYALEVPSGAEVTVEGNNTLHGTGSYALVCYSLTMRSTQAAKIYPSTLPEILHRTVFRLRAAMLRSRAAAPSRSLAWCAQRKSRLRRGTVSPLPIPRIWPCRASTVEASLSPRKTEISLLAAGIIITNMQSMPAAVRSLWTHPARFELQIMPAIPV